MHKWLQVSPWSPGIVSEFLKRMDTRTHVRANYYRICTIFLLLKQNLQNRYFFIFSTQSDKVLYMFVYVLYSSFITKLCAKFYEGQFWPHKKITFRRSALCRSWLRRIFQGTAALADVSCWLAGWPLWASQVEGARPLLRPFVCLHNILASLSASM